MIGCLSLFSAATGRNRPQITKTPPLTLQLNPGIHQVTISLAGFNPWTKKINAYEGLAVKAILERKPAPEKKDD